MYTYTRPQKGEVFRTRDGGTCHRLQPLDLEPRRRTITQMVGLAFLFPLASLASGVSIILDYLHELSSKGLDHD